MPRIILVSLSGMVETLAFRRSKSLVVAERLVIPADPGTPPSEEEIFTLCRDKLAGYKRPKAIRFISPEEMPRTGSGKILHRALRERHTDIDQRKGG